MDGTIMLTPQQAAQIRLALMMAMEGGEPSADYEAIVRAAYELLHPTAPINGASR